MYTISAAKLKARISELSNYTITSFSQDLNDAQTPGSSVRNNLQAVWNIADIIEKTTFPLSLEKDLSKWFKYIEEEEGSGIFKIDDSTVELGKAFLDFINAILDTKFSKLPFLNKLRQLQMQLNQKIIDFKYSESSSVRLSSVAEDDPSADHKTRELSSCVRQSSGSSNQSRRVHEPQLSEEPRSAQELLFERAEKRRELLVGKRVFLMQVKLMLKSRPPVYPDVDNLLICLESHLSEEETVEFKYKYIESETLQYRNKSSEGDTPKKKGFISRFNKPNDPFLKALKKEIKAKITAINTELKIDDISKPEPKKRKIQLLKSKSSRRITLAIETLYDLCKLYSNLQDLQHMERERQEKQQYGDYHAYLTYLRTILEEMESVQGNFEQLQAAFAKRMQTIENSDVPPPLEVLIKLNAELDGEMLAIKQELEVFQEKLHNVCEPSDFEIPKEIIDKITKFQTASTNMVNSFERMPNTQIKDMLSFFLESKKQENLCRYTHNVKQSCREQFFGKGQILNEESRMGAYIANHKSNCFFNRQDGVEKEAFVGELRKQMDAFVDDANSIVVLQKKINEGITKFNHTRTFFGGKEKSFKHQLEDLQAVVSTFQTSTPAP